MVTAVTRSARKATMQPLDGIPSQGLAVQSFRPCSTHCVAQHATFNSPSALPSLVLPQLLLHHHQLKVVGKPRDTPKAAVLVASSTSLVVEATPMVKTGHVVLVVLEANTLMWHASVLASLLDARSSLRRAKAVLLKTNASLLRKCRTQLFEPPKLHPGKRTNRAHRPCTRTSSSQ
jgi:hypothetical protein